MQGITGNCTVVVLQLNLSTTPSAAGQFVYAALQARVVTAYSGLALLIDDGSGTWMESSAESASHNEWRILSFAAPLMWDGQARVGLRLFGRGTLHAEVARVVVSRVGTPWHLLAA